jgi:copper transport protein
MVLVRSTPLDDFLADAGSSTETGERIQRIGLFGSLTGVVLATGLLVFLAVVHRGERQEIRLLLRIAAAAGFVITVGAGVEIAGVASILDTGWSDALTSSAGSAAMMRLLAGLLILLGLFEHTVPVGGAPVGGADAHELEASASTRSDDQVERRWVPSSASAFGLAGVLVGVLSFGFDGHTVKEGPRVVHSIVNAVHVTAAGTWFGGIVGLAAVSMIRRRSGAHASPLVVRFSAIASIALIAVVIAGGAMSLMIVDGLGDYTSTEWGRRLIVKLAVTGFAVAIGAYNHFVVVPALESDADVTTTARRAGRTVLGEAVLLLVVAIATVFLVGASTS